MNIKYFIQARANQVAAYYGRDNMLELAVEAIKKDLLLAIGDDVEMADFYKFHVMRTLTVTYEVDVPKAIKKLLE